METGDYNKDDIMRDVDGGFDVGVDPGLNMGNASMPSEQNLIEWQLDFKKDLEEIRLYLSGYREGYDDKGNWTHIAPDKGEEVPLNDFGVNVIMGHVRSYLNRNTVLSNYKEDRIRKILFDLGNKLGDEVEQTYEKLGMDTDYKKRRFPLIIMNILHMVESAYLRAMGGGERESLRKTMNVSQSGSVMPGQPNNQQRSGGFKLTRPGTWLK